ncbi:hypothetical protein KKH3_04770 [Pectobacterium actinidiae]|nr:hypothetical protein KKH3_04770 [Pectobacterium actinidiae]
MVKERSGFASGYSRSVIVERILMLTSALGAAHVGKLCQNVTIS